MANRAESQDKNSFLRFYDGEGFFYDNFSVWVTDRNIKNRQLIWNYPKDSQAQAGTADHIFPSPNSMPNLSEPVFHMATLTPADGIRVIYSLIFEANKAIQFGGSKGTFTIDSNNLIILAIESKYLHPSSFKNILTFLFNHLTYTSEMFETELHIYLKPEMTRSVTQTQFCCLPFNINPDAEIGRFMHFIFSTLKVNQILTILFYLLCGSNILVTSVSTTQLCFGCFSMLSLLYPIQWPNMFVTALPEHLLECVSTPFPFIIGIPFNFLGRNELADINSDLIVNLDFYSITLPESPNITDLYSVLLKKMKKMISHVLKSYREFRVFPANRIQQLIWQFVTGIALIATDMTDADLTDNNLHKTIAKKMLEMSRTKKDDMPPILVSLLESTVIIHFYEQMIENKISAIPPEFFEVPKQMASLMKAINGRKKKRTT